MQIFIKETTPGHAPTFATPGSAGADLRAANEMPVTIAPGDSHIIPCGFEMQLPMGFEAQIRPRSGLAVAHQVTILNSPGTIDSDYRGQVGAVLINHSKVPFVVNKGDRIAQMVINEVPVVGYMAVENLDLTARGSGGFGSTGV